MKASTEHEPESAQEIRLYQIDREVRDEI